VSIFSDNLVQLGHRLINRLLQVVGLAAAVALIIEVGWPLNTTHERLLHTLITTLLCAFIGAEMVRWCLSGGRLNYLWKNRLTFVFVLCALLTVVFEDSIAFKFKLYFPDLPFRWLTLIYLMATECLIIGGAILNQLRNPRRGWISRMRPALIMALSFLSLILMGAFLLTTPNATVGSLSWLDSLFTSTSAVCVTGLTVVDTATQFTFTGQAILLFLIQMGGLGIMTLTYFLAGISGSGMSLRDRVLLQEMFSIESLGRLTGLLVGIVGFTFLCEAIGAFFIYLSWKPLFTDTPLLIWQAVFHSISAFCNAGFSLFSENLYHPGISTASGGLSVICLLVVLGGLGYTVIRELIGWSWAQLLKVGGWGNEGKWVRPLSVQSRLVLWTTVVLIVGGALCLFFAGLVSGHQPGMALLGEAFFNSIICRTAGFNITLMSDYLPAAVLIFLFLMFVGGSPGGTAGGIKTTTFAVAVLNLRRLVRGQHSLEVFGRRFLPEVSHQAFSIVLLSMAWISGSMWVILLSQPQFSFVDVAFECVSAFATVGLSRGITSELNTVGKIVIILSMFVGRIGIMTFVFAIIRRSDPLHRELPCGSVTLN
jgi:Trk-type K+ transport system membrane component